MNESACPIFKHEESLNSGRHRSNMKTSINQNILFVVVISLSIASIESAMFPAFQALHRKDPRKILRDRSLTKHSDFLIPISGRPLSGKDTERFEKKTLEYPVFSRSKYSNEAIKKYEKAVLSLLGISKPNRPDRQITVPQIMLDLYKQRATKNAWTSQGRKYRSVNHFEAEIVRSFAVESKVLLIGDAKPKVILKSVLDGHHFFNEEIIGAELRIFYVPEDKSSITRRKIEVYLLKRRKLNGYKKFLDRNFFENEPPRWMSFNVTEALKLIQRDSKLQVIFEIDDKIDDENSREGQKSIEGLTSPLISDARHQSILVIYSNNKLSQKPLSQNRRKRSLSEGNRYPKRGSLPHRQRLYKQFQKQCSRRPLYVDFAELDWLEWIVAPSGFHAFLCQGTCQREIQHYNATNHAVLQSLLHFKNSTIVPSTCCVPTQLSPIALLIVDFDTVVLKNYKDMIVDSCGCR